MRCMRCGGQASLKWLESDRKYIVPGATVELGRLASDDQVQRFDVVAFQSDDELILKRVWGLPGEQLSFVNGDLLINGQRIQKTLAELDRVAIRIDAWPQNAHPLSKLTNSPSWQVNNQSLALVQVKKNLKLQKNDTLRWAYHLPSRVHPHEIKAQNWLVPSLVVDDYVCNQGLTYEFQPVFDLLIEIKFAKPLQSELILDVLHGSISHGVRITSEPAKEAASPGLSAVRNLKFALCDGQILAASDIEAEKVLGVVDAFSKPSLHDSQTSSSVIIQALESEVAIEHISIARDLFLRSGFAREVNVDFPTLPEERYFVLGDNLPASVDSRQNPAGILRSSIGWSVPPK